MTSITSLLPIALLTSGLAGAEPVETPVLHVIYADPPGSGFHDPTPATPVPGNEATTLGGQRRAAMQAAADMWAARIDSEVPIRIWARFRDLGCGANSIAGTGQTWSSFRNFPNAPLANTDYPSALASALAGKHLGDNEAEIRVAFNGRLDTNSDCNPYIPDGFWYGLDHETPFIPGTLPFLSLAQHEIGHGLGFQTLTDLDTGRFSGEPPRPDIYSTHLYSVSRNRYWPELTPEQRLASIADEDDLVWAGDHLNETEKASRSSRNPMAKP